MLNAAQCTAANERREAAEQSAAESATVAAAAASGQAAALSRAADMERELEQLREGQPSDGAVNDGAGAAAEPPLVSELRAELEAE
eukprot:3411825-Prymnesium_polylepis.1